MQTIEFRRVKKQDRDTIDVYVDGEWVGYLSKLERTRYGTCYRIHLPNTTHYISHRPTAYGLAVAKAETIELLRQYDDRDCKENIVRTQTIEFRQSRDTIYIYVDGKRLGHLSRMERTKYGTGYAIVLPNTKRYIRHRPFSFGLAAAKAKAIELLRQYDDRDCKEVERASEKENGRR